MFGRAMFERGRILQAGGCGFGNVEAVSQPLDVRNTTFEAHTSIV